MVPQASRSQGSRVAGNWGPGGRRAGATHRDFQTAFPLPARLQEQVPIRAGRLEHVRRLGTVQGAGQQGRG